MRVVGWIIVAIAAAGGAKPAKPVKPAAPAMPAVAKYEAALAKARAQRRADVEALYGLALRAGAEVLRDLTKVSREQFAGRAATPAVTAVPGLALSWENVLYAEPQPAFFAALAREKGSPADRAFFERLAATKPGGTWPVYIQQVTDDTGCVRFEAGTFVPVYEGWLAFRERFPKAYVAAAKQELERAHHALAGTCACGKRSEVAVGLAEIAKRLAGTSAGKIAQTQLAALAAEQSALEFDCRPR